MKPTEVLVLSSLLLALCLTSLFALWRRANRIQSAVAGAPRIRWTYTPGSSPLSGIALAPNGTIHFAAADGIYALSPEGRLLWKSPLPSGPVVAAPTLAPSGRLYAACQSGMLFALDASGNLIWQSVSTQPWRTMTRSTSPTTTPICLRLHRGWAPTSIGNIEGHNPVWLFAIGRDGKQRWMVRPSNVLRGSPVVDDTGVIYFCDSDFVKAILPDSQSHWYLRSDCNSGPALAADGMLYLGTNGPEERQGPRKSFLTGVTPDGHLKWKIEIQGMVRDAPAIASDGTIFFTTDKGYAYAISDAGSPPMDSPWPRFQHDAQNSGRIQVYR